MLFVGVDLVLQWIAYDVFKYILICNLDANYTLIIYALGCGGNQT